MVEFDPLVDAALPAGTAGIYLGGGFPEVHAAELAENRCLIAELRSAIAAGIPTVRSAPGCSTCAESLDGTPMVGAVPADAAMKPRLTLGYRTATSPADSVLTEAGEQVTGHEFHRTAITSVELDGHAAWQLPDGPRRLRHADAARRLPAYALGRLPSSGTTIRAGCAQAITR